MAAAHDDDDAMDQGGDGWLSPQTGRQAALDKPLDAGAAAKPVRAPRKKNPKLDLDLLEADGGFNDIWHKMAPAFKASFQGEGHEVADLLRLLELFQRWQTRFYPHCDFDTFVTKLEKAGRSRMVKAKMHSMRQNLLGLIFPTEEPGASVEGGEAAAVAGGGGGVGGGAAPQRVLSADGRGGGGCEDDEELVAMQREAEWETAYEAMDELERAHPPLLPPPGRSAAAVAMAPSCTATDMDMEELMQLAEEMHYGPPTAACSTVRTDSVAVAIRALDGGVLSGGGSDSNAAPAQQQEEEEEEEDGSGHRSGGGGGAAAVVYDNLDDDDEELRVLAMGFGGQPELPGGDMVEEGVQRQWSSGSDVMRDEGLHRGATATTSAGAAALESEDEELRQLAAMEMETAVASLQTTTVDATVMTGLDVDGDGGTHDPSVQQQYGGTVGLDAELLALPIDPPATQGGRDNVSGTVAALWPATVGYGGSTEAYGSNGDELPLEQGLLGELARGSSTAITTGWTGCPLSDSQVSYSQDGMEAGLALRDLLLLTQTQMSQPDDEH